MQRPFTLYLAALVAVGGVVWATTTFLPVLGLASAALLFLLPVLFAAARGGLGPGLFAALASAAAYNFFLLPPRYTFRIHAPENLVSVIVLVAVALVTSRLATRLKAREIEALDRARLSAELAELSAALAGNPAASAFDRGVALVAERYGQMQVLADPSQIRPSVLLSSLDQAAAAWAQHNGDVTGHGTEVMPAADWTFLPLAPRNRRDRAVAAIAQRPDGTTRSRQEIDHLAQLALLLGQCRDRDALEAERRERELLAESNRLRQTLLAALSHDLRTPMTVLVGRLELLARDHPSAAEAMAAAVHLQHSLSDLLEAARIEDGALQPALESIDPVDAVTEALGRLALRPGVALQRDIRADLPFVRADAVLLDHILANLFDNAQRHARALIRVEGRAIADAVLLSIVDDGPGVPEAERDRIFERFARAEGSDRTSGSGLGLAIVKGLSDAMGMTVSVDQAPGGGARFTLAMPLAKAPSA
ncbi:sensor histidine kinase [Novosphingobium percolationis]|uniref:sensor histidine kinase n=1 Tax=Novosphingobium percolationis TaxID=2871811 RepID=UPI001CD3E1EB|nr:DUF4118 domain-containing protein [Novosphingobium percolationis]